jgi:hypothetical protein
MRTMVATILALWMAATGGVETVEAQMPSQFLYVARVQVRLGQLVNWETYQRQVVEAQRRLGDGRAVGRFQTRLGGPVLLFHVTIPLEEYGELDSWRSVPQLLREAYGDEEGMRILEAGGSLEASVETEVHVLLPEFSSGLNQDATGRPILQVVTTEVDPARIADYEAFLGALARAEESRGIRRIRRVSTMGELYQYTAVEQFPTFAEFRQGLGVNAVVLEEYGDVVGQNLIDRANAAVRGRVIEVLQLREDLSYAPN